MFSNDVNTNPDGMAHLLKADGSSAQVGVVENQLVITEKGTPGAVVAGSSGNGVIETVNLSARDNGVAIVGDPNYTGFSYNQEGAALLSRPGE